MSGKVVLNYNKIMGKTQKYRERTWLFDEFVLPSRTNIHSYGKVTPPLCYETLMNAINNPL